jgi:hypothetical protein
LLIGYSVTATTWAAISIARSSLVSTIQYPARDSLISANGPSVGAGAPSANRTVVVWVGSIRCLLFTTSPDSRSSRSMVIIAVRSG